MWLGWRMWRVFPFFSTCTKLNEQFVFQTKASIFQYWKRKSHLKYYALLRFKILIFVQTFKAPVWTSGVFNNCLTSGDMLMVIIVEETYKQIIVHNKCVWLCEWHIHFLFTSSALILSSMSWCCKDFSYLRLAVGDFVQANKIYWMWERELLLTK